ncbi:MAG: hypothetical protein AB8G77_06780 [Rhodothermales bacterium]
MEEIFVPLIVFGFVALIVKMSLDYNKWKQVHKGGGTLDEGSADKSMGVSELQNLIEEAVHNANSPLLERISSLEDQLADKRVLVNAKEERKQLSEPAPDKEI